MFILRPGRKEVEENEFRRRESVSAFVGWNPKKSSSFFPGRILKLLGLRVKIL